MQRKVFDMLISGIGAVMVVVLIVAGALAMWASSFANTNVHNQLAEQQIFFPPKALFENPPKGSTEITPAMKPFLAQYGGQQLLTGAQAEAYADHFIAVHLSEMPYGVSTPRSAPRPSPAPTTPNSKASKQLSSKVQLSAASSSKPTASPPSAKSPSGPASPRSASRSSWPSSLGSGSDTHAAPPPTLRSSTPPRSNISTAGTDFSRRPDSISSCPGLAAPTRAPGLDAHVKMRVQRAGRARHAWRSQGD